MIYKERSLDELGVLKYTENQTVNRNIEMGVKVLVPISENEWKEIDVSKIRSTYLQQNETNGERMYYHLHPEFIDNEESICICSNCCSAIAKDKIPELSIANGVDFGDYNRIGLTKLNEYEMSIIAVVSTYFKIIKITTNDVRRNNFSCSKF